MKRLVVLSLLVLTLAGCTHQAKNSTPIPRELKNTLESMANKDNSTPIPEDMKKSLEDLSNKATNDEKVTKDVCNAIQNEKDDETIDAKEVIFLPSEFGDKEPSIVKRYKQDRLLAKESELETLVENYALVPTLGVDIETGKDLSESLVNSDKPTVILRTKLTCPSCHKSLDYLAADYSKDKDYNLVILVYKNDIDKNGNEAVPEVLRQYIKVVDVETPKSLELKRYPSTVFLTAEGKLFDIGGCLTSAAIDQIIKDMPDFTNYTLESEVSK